MTEEQRFSFDQDISKLQTEICKLQKELSEVPRSHVFTEKRFTLDTDGSESNPSDNMDINILKHKCKQLTSLIKNTTNNKLFLLPVDPYVRGEVFKDDRNKRIVQLRECCTFLQVQRKEIQEDIDKEEKQHGELEDVLSAAEMKQRDYSQQRQSNQQVYERLESKIATVEKLNKENKKQMRKFLDENYPLPDQTAFSKVKKKVNTGCDTSLISLDDLLPLKDIIQELMNTCITTPNEPYITLDHRYWPPYIELLLQCDLACRHPLHAKQIKLMPFHL